MEIEGAESVGHEKWRARLACGHDVLCDASVNPPDKKQLQCPYCEYQEEWRE